MQDQDPGAVSVRGSRSPRKAAQVWVLGLACAAVYLPLLLNGLYLPHLAGQPWAYWTADFLAWVVLPSAMALWLWRAHGLSPSGYGLGPPPPLSWLAVPATVATLVFAATYLAGRELGRLMGGVTDGQGYSIMLPDSPGRVLGQAYLSLTAAVIEETLFRGAMFRLLDGHRDRVRAVLYVAVSTGLFASIHWENGWSEVANTGLVGLLACVMYLRWRDLWPLLIAHFVTDMLAFS